MLQSFIQIAGSDIAQVDTSAKQALGTIGYGQCFIDTATANAPAYVSGPVSGDTVTEYDGNLYIYLQGCASTIAGSVVTYNLNGATTLVTTSTTPGLPIAVATAAIAATTSYGWYVISGAAVVATNADVAANTRLQTTATGGKLDDTTTANVYTNSIIARAATTAGAAALTVGQVSGFPLANLAL